MGNKKVKLNLVGKDGNAYSLMGLFIRQAEREGWTAGEIDEVIEKCTEGDYNHLLVTLMEHCR